MIARKANQKKEKGWKGWERQVKRGKEKMEVKNGQEEQCGEKRWR